MAKMKRGLGKGLDSMIPNKKESIERKSGKETIKTLDVKKENVSRETLVRLSDIEPKQEQPRKRFNEDSIVELADSIRQVGVIQPLILQKVEDHYEIIAGERRYRAARLAGLKEVPSVIRDLSEQQVLEIALIENIQREDLNPIEEAQAYKRLLTEFNLKQDEVAERVAKSRTAVTNSMRLLKLCDNVQQMIIDGMISTGHARALISIEDPEQQYTVAQQIFDEKLSVRDVEKLVKNLNQPPKVKKAITTDKSLEAVYQNIEENLKQKLSTKVSITPKGNGTGKIEIEFYSHEDLEKLMDLLSK